MTHILNAAQGQKFAQIDTTAAYYKHDKWNIDFMGVQAMDIAKYKLSDHFETAAEYIHKALESGGTLFITLIFWSAHIWYTFRNKVEGSRGGV